jgi:fused signal recognition particle receptor
MNITTEEVLQFLLGGNTPMYLTFAGLGFIILAIIGDLLKRNTQAEAPDSASVAVTQKQKHGTSSTTLDTAPPLADKLSSSRATLLSGLRNIFSMQKDILSPESNEWLESFKELLIESDMGVRTSKKIITSIKENLISESGTAGGTASDIQDQLKDILFRILDSDELPEITPERVSGKPKVILVVGVNGAGKTTTIGKLAFQYQAQGAKVLIAACDTFRAAAVHQLEVWKDRANAAIEKGEEGEKPSTVAYRAIHRAAKENFDVLLIDTAGRLHTRANLMKELSGILSIINREQDGAPHETILVVDGSTGQNALQQAREFNEVTTLSGIVITKLDGTPKGGVVVAIKDELDIPIRYIGVGESVADLRPFDAGDFVAALLGQKPSMDPSNESADAIEIYTANRENHPR